MAKYKIKKRKRGLGYVYIDSYTHLNESSIASLQKNTQSISNTWDNLITKNIENPEKFAEYINKRDQGIIKILDLYKIPYTVDNSYGSSTIGLKNEQTSNVITDEYGNEVTIEEVIEDPEAEVILTDDLPTEKNNNMLYAGIGVATVAAILILSKKNKKEKK